jgi:hypothetical protein
MARDTKPNLSNAKFEQCVGDIMTLSGCTEVHGFFEIENGGTFRLDDGNQQQDYILTSNSGGCGSWIENKGLCLTGTTNGLTTYPNALAGLGGTLTESTTSISGSCNNLNVGVDTIGNQIDLYQSHAQCWIHQAFFRSLSCPDILGSIAYIQSVGDAPAQDITTGEREMDIGVFIYTGVTGNNCFRGSSHIRFFDGLLCSCDNTTSSHITIFDNADEYPMQYWDDYSANISCRSIPDAGWVNSQISTCTSGFINAANNGLTKISTNVRLGGTLLCNTTIDGSSGTYNLGFTNLNQFNLSFDSTSTITDNGSNGGLRYAADYSPNYVARSIPDVAFVTGQTSGFLTGASEGLNVVNSEARLGGSFTSPTTISGGSGTYFNITAPSIFIQNPMGSYQAQLSINSDTVGFVGVYGSNLTTGGVGSSEFFIDNQTTGGYGKHCLGGRGFCFEYTTGSTCTTMRVSSATNGILIKDNYGSYGMKYEADYSASGTTNPRWIPDFAAVTAHTASVSDIRLKDNLRSLKKIDISTFEPYEFEFNELSRKCGEKSYGLIAQDVELLFPHAVCNNYVGSDGKTYKTIDYNQIIPLLVSKVKELEKISKNQ